MIPCRMMKKIFVVAERILWKWLLMICWGLESVIIHLRSNREKVKIGIVDSKLDE